MPLRLLLLAAVVLGVALCAVALAGGAVVLGAWWALARTGAAALVAFHVAAGVAALASDALGFGEVELLGALGPVLGWTGRGMLLAGVFLGAPGRREPIDGAAGHPAGGMAHRDPVRAPLLTGAVLAVALGAGSLG